MIAFGGKRIDAVKNGGKTNERPPFCKLKREKFTSFYNIRSIL